MPVYTDCPHNGTICIAYFTWSKSRDKSCLCGTGVLLFFHYSCEEVSSWASAGKTVVICYDATKKVKYKIQEANNQVILTTSELTVLLDIIQNQVRFATKDGKELLAEKPSSTGFTSFNDAGNSTYRIRQTFLLDSDEAIYGLGQHQQGKMNQRNQTLFLQQANTEICIPLVHSIKGYALFWDNYSPTTFTDNAQGMTFDSEVGELCDYYFVYGGGADKVVAGLRELTGQAPMFPLWTFGFGNQESDMSARMNWLALLRNIVT